MSIASEISSIRSSLEAAWAAVIAKGGYDNPVHNLANLVNSINRIWTATSNRSVEATPGADVLGTITDLSNQLEKVYEAIENHYGTIPTHKNFDNLAAAIASIPLPYFVLRSLNEDAVTYSVQPYFQVSDLQALCAGTLEFDGTEKVNNETCRYLDIYPKCSEVTSITTVTNFCERWHKLSCLNGFQYLTHLTSIGDRFCSMCSQLRELNGSISEPFEFPAGITSIGDLFFQVCMMLQTPIVLPAGLKSIGTHFMSNCQNYRHPITIPAGVTEIKDRFLENAALVPRVTLPEGVTSIGESFCWGHKVNLGFNIPSTVRTIGKSFLSMSGSSTVTLTQSITIPEGVTTIEESFLQHSRYNGRITLPSTLTTIKLDFLYDTKVFNQSLTIPAAVKTIGTSFMEKASSFTQPLAIPAGVTAVGQRFMKGANNFVGPLTVNTSAVPPDEAPAGSDFRNLSASDLAAPMFVTGVTLAGAGATAWKNALPDLNEEGNYRKLLLAS